MIRKYLPILQKYFPIVFDIMIVLAVSILFAPFQPLPPKIFIIIVFIIYNLLFFLFNKNRNFGMVLTGARWKQDYPQNQQLVYLGLYTLSFASIFYNIFFPFDLLLLNIVFLQAPSLIFRGMTFPHYLAGRMEVIVGPLP